MFTTYLKSLSKPIVFSSYIYVGGIISYNSAYAYVDSKNKLMKFRKNELNEHEKKYINDEWSAVKHGAEEYSLDRFCCSLIWPVRICSHFVPSIVLMINKEKPSN
jgi:hypothetical protein